jgi:hypothetical protein
MSDERKKALQEVIDLCELASQQAEAVNSKLTPAEISEQYVLAGAAAQARKLRDAIKLLMEQS